MLEVAEKPPYRPQEPRLASALAGAAALALALVPASYASAQTTTPADAQLVIVPVPGPAPAPAPYAPAPAPPMQETVQTRPNLGLIITGAVMLGVSWIVNIVVGLPAGDDPFRTGGAGEEWTAFRLSSIVPVAGPWIQLAVKPTNFMQDSWGMYLVIDGLLQAAGLTLLVIGVATPSEVRTYARVGDVDLSLVPRAGAEGAGLSLVGRF